MKVLKGKSSEYLRRDFPELSKKFWGLHVWARGYFVNTVGIDREVIKRYVKEDQEQQIREDQLRPGTRTSHAGVRPWDSRAEPIRPRRSGMHPEWIVSFLKEKVQGRIEEAPSPFGNLLYEPKKTLVIRQA